MRGAIFSERAKLSDWARGVIEEAQPAVAFQLSPSLLAKISNKDQPSELMLLLGIPKDDLSRIKVKNDLLVVVMDRSARMGNLGTIIRSADALGANGVVMTGHSVDLYSQDTINATTGSLFGLPVVRLSSGAELARWVDEIRVVLPELQVVGTDEGGQVALTEVDFTNPTVLLLGNETHGLSAAFMEMADQLARIPMYGKASSLNVACAASICLYEIDRQRRAP